MKANGFFCSLHREALRQFEELTYTTAYPEGAVLFVEQEAPRGVFVICRGKVKISMTSSEGKTIILRIAKPGEVLGLHAVISDEPYHASAESLEPCQVKFMRRDDFLRFVREQPEASLHAARQLSADYHIACEQVRALGLAQSAPEKLAGFLLDWASNSQSGDGVRSRLTLTHEEIGQMIGASRETVTRTLTDFRNRQLVRLKGSMLVIQNRAGLAHFAGM
jgi:CRP/FNR family transcriptional regulator